MGNGRDLEGHVKEKISEWKDAFGLGLAEASLVKLVAGVVAVVSTEEEADVAIDVLYRKYDRGYENPHFVGLHSHDITDELNRGSSDVECLRLVDSPEKFYAEICSKLGERGKKS